MKQSATRSRTKPAAQVPDIRFTAEEIVLRPIDELVPFPNNPKTHPAEQVTALAAAMVEFGFDQPILIDEHDTILKGHGRQLAARKAGFAQVPTIKREGLTAGQKIAIVISDNQLPTLGGWDQSLLRINLTNLAKLDFPLHLTGFNEVRLATFMGGNAGNGDPDAEAEPQPDPVTKRGEVWLLGSHRIICGDSTNKDDVATLLGDDRPHLMVTDPPYGVDYDPAWRARAGINKNKAKMGVVANDDRADWREAWALFPGDVGYVWHGALHAAEVAESLAAEGFRTRAQIVWAKDRLVMGRGDYHWQHEPCWYVVRSGAVGHWSGDRKQATLWNIPSRDDSGHGHSTQKPVECMKRPIENNSLAGDFIYEPFSGSGTTIIAAEMSGRRCLAIELKPVYVDLAVRRWQKFTSQKAVLQGTKKTFDQVEKERSTVPA